MPPLHRVVAEALALHRIAQQHANRVVLRDAMQREGFRNYPMEWWHYTLEPEPTPHTIYDVPVQ